LLERKPRLRHRVPFEDRARAPRSFLDWPHACRVSLSRAVPGDGRARRRWRW